MIKYHFNQIGKKNRQKFIFSCFVFFVYSGAQGEYAGLRVIRAYHEHQDEPQRRVKE